MTHVRVWGKYLVEVVQIYFKLGRETNKEKLYKNIKKRTYIYVITKTLFSQYEILKISRLLTLFFPTIFDPVIWNFYKLVQYDPSRELRSHFETVE